VVQSRLKLSLHLPLPENRVMLWMVFFGGGTVAALLLVVLLALVIIALAFFPVEVMRSMLLTMLPWSLAGLAGYFLAATIIVEPRWLRRVFYILLGYGFLDALVLNVAIEAYRSSLIWFVLLAAFTLPGILLSGFRFRKGVR
jgi:predicted membrane channel-forming protein YqfA (hemolysin III family)